MACCFSFGRGGGRRRLRLRGRGAGGGSSSFYSEAGSEHDVYLYPAASGNGEVLLQYGGTLRPELVYGAHINALGLETTSLANATSATGTNTIPRATLDDIAPARPYSRYYNNKHACDECTICLEPFDTTNNTSNKRILLAKSKSMSKKNNINITKSNPNNNNSTANNTNNSTKLCKSASSPIGKGQRDDKKKKGNSGCLVRTLPRCNHVFHSQCITTWLRNSQACPVCMQSVVEAHT